MYIEFRIPAQIGQWDRIGISINCINIDIDDWVRKHDIQYHKTKLHKNTYRLILKDEEAYTHFALTWKPKYYVSTHFIFKQPK